MGSGKVGAEGGAVVRTLDSWGDETIEGLVADTHASFGGTTSVF